MSHFTSKSDDEEQPRDIKEISFFFLALHIYLRAKLSAIPSGCLQPFLSNGYRLIIKNVFYKQRKLKNQQRRMKSIYFIIIFLKNIIVWEWQK